MYRKTMEQPYGYLLVDLKPDTPDDWRYRPNVLADTEYDEVEVSAQQPAPLPLNGTNLKYSANMTMAKQHPWQPAASPGKPLGERHTEYTICEVLDELRQLRRDIKPDPD